MSIRTRRLVLPHSAFAVTEKLDHRWTIGIYSSDPLATVAVGKSLDLIRASDSRTGLLGLELWKLPDVQ